MTKNNRGYSFIEIILYIGLLGMFIVSMTNLFVTSIDLKLETEANSAVEIDSRYLMSRFRYDITHASSISTPPSVGSQGNTLLITRDGVSYTYSVDGNRNLLVTSAGNTDQLNSSRSHVTSVNFKRLGSVGGKNSITMNITLESVTQRAGKPETRSLTSTYALR